MRRINQCHNKQLLALCQAAMQFDDLNRKIIPLLPENLRGHWRVGSFNKGCLILVTSKPAFATELRYYLPTLRDTLRTTAGLYQLVSIKIQINIEHYSKNQSTNQPQEAKPQLSVAARKTMNDAAERCAYPALKEILLRLGS